MTRTVIRVSTTAFIGLLVSIATFSILIWLGYEQALTSGEPIQFLTREIYQFENGIGVANQNQMVTILGAGFMGIAVLIGELGIRLKRK
ncbi:MAG: LlsX family protein [Paracoccaceae bacterium]|nr:MAG: LlsX family protein [Paracoccaceae bacterium]